MASSCFLMRSSFLSRYSCSWPVRSGLILFNGSYNWDWVWNGGYLPPRLSLSAIFDSLINCFYVRIDFIF